MPDEPGKQATSAVRIKNVCRCPIAFKVGYLYLRYIANLTNMYLGKALKMICKIFDFYFLMNQTGNFSFKPQRPKVVSCVLLTVFWHPENRLLL